MDKEMNKSGDQTEKEKPEEKWTDSKGMWDTFKLIDILIFNNLRREKEKKTESIFEEITSENFLSFM